MTDLVRTSKAIISAAQRLGSLQTMMLGTSEIVNELYRVLDELDNRPYAGATLVEQARDRYAGDDVAIDTDALVSEAEDGAWVEAWVWVPTTEA